MALRPQAGSQKKKNIKFAMKILNLNDINAREIVDFLRFHSDVEQEKFLSSIDDNSYGMLIDNSLAGIIKWSLLKWDTDFFKRPMARIPFFSVNENKNLAETAEALLTFVISKCKEAGVVHIDASKELKNFDYHRAFQKVGFIVVDIKVTLDLEINKYEHKAMKATDDLRFRPANIADMPELQDICAYSFRLSRFYKDPFFSLEEANSMHQAWIMNIKNSANSIVLVAEYDSQIVGFTTLSLKDGYGVIDLIAIKDGFRGRGIGSALLSELVNWAQNKVTGMTISTQINNYTAVNLYTNLGFKLIKSEISYSKEI